MASSLGASMFVTGRRLATVEAIGVALWGLPLTLSGALPYEPVVLALMCVIGAGNALVDIGLYTLIPRLVPEELLARVFGAFESLTALTVAIGALVTPLVIDLLGIRGALVVLGLVAPGLVALAWRRMHAIDASIAHRDEEVEVLNKVGIFRPLPMPAIDILALHVDHAQFPAGQEVFHQGDRGDRFYVIEDGEADVIGDGRLIRTMGPGDGLRRDRAAAPHAAHDHRARSHTTPALHPRPARLRVRRQRLPVERAGGGHADARPARHLRSHAVGRPGDNRWRGSGDWGCEQRVGLLAGEAIVRRPAAGRRRYGRGSSWPPA